LARLDQLAVAAKHIAGQHRREAAVINVLPQLREPAPQAQSVLPPKLSKECIPMSRFLPLLCLMCCTSLTDKAPDFPGLTEGIEAGEFQRATSVLIARKGEVLYEHYFDEAGADGRRWWLMQFPVGDLVWKSFAMNGAGGNTVQQQVVVITTENFDVPQPHKLTLKQLMEKIFPQL
jgi:hypothetical protein